MFEKRVLRWATVLIAGAMTWGGSLCGQSIAGDIVGVAKDPSGAGIPDVALILVDEERNISVTTKSDADGNYIFARIRPARYSITAEKAGFSKRTISGIILNVSQRVRADIELNLGSVAESVTVAASAQTIDSDNVAVGVTMMQKVIVELPLNGRNFIELAKLSPGVMENTRGNLATQWEGRKDQQLVVAGLNNADVSFLLDGIETRSPRWGSAGFKPSIDAIQEFKLERNLFRANQGFATVAVNTTLKSGTNSLHGSLFEFLRNNKLDARNFFDPGARPPFKQNQYGAFVGGRLIRDKLFFFGGYEGFRQRLGRAFRGLVPLASELQGDFSRSASPIIDWTTRAPFPNNRIPANRQSTVGLNLAKRYPGPNVTDSTLNYVRSDSQTEDFDQFHGKLDYVLDANNRFFFRASDIDNPQFAPNLFAQEAVTRPLADRNYAFNYTRILSPSMLNEFRLGYNGNKSQVGHESAFGPDLSAQIGLKNTEVAKGNEAFPSVSLVGYASAGVQLNTTWDGVDNMYQLADNLSINRGAHSMAFGFEVRHDRYFQRTDFPIAPSFTFNGVFSGNPIADMVLGLPTFAQASVGDSSQNMRGTYYGVYAQDDWKVNRRLTFSYGLRYEYITPWTELNNRQRAFDLVNGGTGFRPDGIRNGILLAGKDLPRGLTRPDRNNFAPRLGLAYTPFGSNTVIRAGFGVYFTPSSHNEFLLRTLGAPFRDVVTLNSFAPTPTVFLDNLFPPLALNPNSDPQTINPSERSSYTMQWNFNVQHKIRDFLVEVGYFGSGSHKINQRFNYNLAAPDPTGRLTLQQRRPYQGWGDLLGNAAIGNASYHSVQARVERRYSHGISLLSSYTFGKNLNDGEQDQYSHGQIRGAFPALKGRSRIDQTHRLVSSFVYDLPFGTGQALASNAGKVTNAVVGGWQVSTIATFGTGAPAEVNVAGDRANIGARRIQPANRIGNGNDSSLADNIRNQPVLSPYFRITDFTLPSINNLGNGGRGYLNLPGFNNWALSLLKNTRLTEGVSLQLRFEFFNAFNHAQFGAPGLTVGTPLFGRITSAGDARSIQIGAKILW